MNPLILASVLLLALNDPVHAHPQQKQSGFDKFLKKLFTPRTPEKPKKPKRKVVRHSVPHSQPKAVNPSSKDIIVDAEWMAHYWELEAAWDYPIPEDDLIKWKDGKYIVPISVFKHYEDMANTPRRIASPQSNVRFPGIPFDG